MMKLIVGVGCCVKTSIDSNQDVGSNRQWYYRSVGSPEEGVIAGFEIGTLSCFPTDVPCDSPLWNIDLGHVDVHPITANDGGEIVRAHCMWAVIDLKVLAFAAVQKYILYAAYPGMSACDLFDTFAKALAPTGYLLLDRLQNIGHSLTQNSS